jgi:hypothetical protein
MSGNPRCYPDGQVWAASLSPRWIPPMPAEPPAPPGSTGPAVTVRPRPAVPCPGGAHRLPRRVSPPLVAAVAVAVCGALVAGGLLLFRQQSDQALPKHQAAAAGKSRGSGRQASPPSGRGPVPSTAAGGPSPSRGRAPRPPASGPGDRLRPPRGFEVANDPSGFGLLVPDGWQRVSRGDQTFYAPDGLKHLIMVRSTVDDGLTLLERIRDFAKSLSGSRQNYHRIRLEPTGDGTDSADLEYTYRDTKFGPRRVIDRAFHSPDGATVYFLLAAGPAKDIRETRERFTKAADSFCPDGYVCSTPGSPSPVP